MKKKVEGTIRVMALRLGFIGIQRRKDGEIFDIEPVFSESGKMVLTAEAQFSDYYRSWKDQVARKHSHGWMVRVNEDDQPIDAKGNLLDTDQIQDLKSIQPLDLNEIERVGRGKKAPAKKAEPEADAPTTFAALGKKKTNKQAGNGLRMKVE